jgi:hypothetical protein
MEFFFLLVDPLPATRACAVDVETKLRSPHALFMTGLIPLPCALDFAYFILALGKNTELQHSVHTHAFPAAIAERTAPEPSLF